MACDATALLASFTGASNLGWEDAMVAKLAILARMVLILNPGSDVSAKTLVAAGTALGYADLSDKERQIAKISLLCQMASI